MTEIVDGVEYATVPCVRCGTTMSTATDALRLADRARWPLCSNCSRGALAFTVIGVPAPQGSKTKTRWGVREDNPNTKPWRATVAAEAALARTTSDLHYGPVVVDALFVFPRPKAHYRTGRHAGELKPSAPYWCATNPDGDKCARAVGDALSGVLLRDDNLIVEWRIRKVYGDPARAEIRITPALDRPSGAAKEEPE